jgi:CheY-like chemotaxis protein
VALDVRDVMDSSIRMAAVEIRHRARLTKNYLPVPPVLADEGRLGQVFLNLLVNAAQSIEEGAVSQNEICISASPGPRDDVIVEVRDTGCGIGTEELGRVFDVFFTTKPIGVGTGLGLAICHRILADLGGRIEVESELGSGSCFRVVLPVAKHAGAELAAAPPPLVHSPRPSRVLVIDDELALARSIARLLSDEHDAEPIASARAALARIEAGERFDVILCDLIMPQLTGMQFFEELANAHPDQAPAVIFTTGGAFTAASRAFVERAQRPCLDKPFDLALLRSTVREIVERRSASADQKLGD